METTKNVHASEQKTDAKNLDAILKKYENISVKTASTKNGLFKDSEHLKSADSGRSYRKKMRKQLRELCLHVLTAKQIEKKREAKENFLTHYKKFYALNDFSLSSIYQGSTQHEIEFYTDFFEVLKSIK